MKKWQTWLVVLAGAMATAVAAAAAPTEDPTVRDRLVSELRMSPAQVSRLDAAFDEAQPRLDRLQSLDGDERRRARHKVLAQLNARIVTILTPRQRAGYEQIVREAAANGTGALVRQLR